MSGVPGPPGFGEPRGGIPNYDDERDKTVFRNTTPGLQDQDQDRFFGLKPVLS